MSISNDRLRELAIDEWQWAPSVNERMAMAAELLALRESVALSLSSAESPAVIRAERDRLREENEDIRKVNGGLCVCNEDLRKEVSRLRERLAALEGQSVTAFLDAHGDDYCRTKCKNSAEAWKMHAHVSQQRAECEEECKRLRAELAEAKAVTQETMRQCQEMTAAARQEPPSDAEVRALRRATPQPAPSDAEIEAWRKRMQDTFYYGDYHPNEDDINAALALMRRARPDDGELVRAAEALVAVIERARDMRGVKPLDDLRAALAARKGAE